MLAVLKPVAISVKLSVQDDKVGADCIVPKRLQGVKGSDTTKAK